MSTNSCAFDTISVDGFKVGRDRLKYPISFRFHGNSRKGARGRFPVVPRNYRSPLLPSLTISSFHRDAFVRKSRFAIHSSKLDLFPPFLPPFLAEEDSFFFFFSLNSLRYYRVAILIAPAAINLLTYAQFNFLVTLIRCNHLVRSPSKREMRDIASPRFFFFFLRAS